MSKTKSALIAVRVDDKTHKKFHRVAASRGGGGVVLRELIAAYIENRVVINNKEGQSK